uniref:ATP-binding cassette domain-containing protein n=1 Tax=Pseudomonas sp. RA_35y_Pfl2_P32 TaxID=3088705 RepID=UPI0030D780FA
RKENQLAEDMVKRLQIKTTSLDLPVASMSGGNQQKVLLARWLATSPRLLVLDEPTRGIDVGAHAEIIRLIRELCNDGLALLVISSELDEIVTYSDRVVVLRDRAHVEELAGQDIDVTNILAAIAAEGHAVAHEGQA